MAQFLANGGRSHDVHEPKRGAATGSDADDHEHGQSVARHFHVDGVHVSAKTREWGELDSSDIQLNEGGELEKPKTCRYAAYFNNVGDNVS